MQRQREEDDKRAAAEYRERMKIDPAIFNREEARTEDLHLQLSEKYMIYKDYAERSMLNPQHIGTFLILIHNRSY